MRALKETLNWNDPSLDTSPKAFKRPHGEETCSLADAGFPGEALCSRIFRSTPSGLGVRRILEGAGDVVNWL